MSPLASNDSSGCFLGVLLSASDGSLARLLSTNHIFIGYRKVVSLFAEKNLIELCIMFSCQGLCPCILVSQPAVLLLSTGLLSATPELLWNHGGTECPGMTQSPCMLTSLPGEPSRLRVWAAVYKL